MVNRSVTALLVVFSLFGVARAETTFLADFDNGFNATFAKGNGEAQLAPEAAPKDVVPVQGKFGKGVFIARKVPPMVLSYETKNNFSSKEGTIEFWFRPAWDSKFTEADGPKYQQGRTEVSLFTTRGAPNGFKLGKSQYNVLQFFYARGYDTSNSYIGRLGNFWTKGKWQYYTAAWDENEARLFLDGKLLAVSDKWRIGGLVFDRFALGSVGGGPHKRDGAFGIFDDFRVSNTKRYISSFAPPKDPLKVEEITSTTKPTPISSDQLETLEEEGTMFYVDFSKSIVPLYARGESTPVSNAAIGPEKIKDETALRMRHYDYTTDDALCYPLHRNIDLFMGSAEILVRFETLEKLPVNLIDFTRVATDKRRLARSDLRTGMRLIINENSCLQWQHLKAGKTLASVSSVPIELKEHTWYRFGFSWKGSSVALRLDGKVLVDNMGLAMPTKLPRYIFVGSNSQAEHIVDGWIKHIRINSK